VKRQLDNEESNLDLTTSQSSFSTLSPGAPVSATQEDIVGSSQDTPATKKARLEQDNETVKQEYGMEMPSLQTIQSSPTANRRETPILASSQQMPSTSGGPGIQDARNDGINAINKARECFEDLANENRLLQGRVNAQFRWLKEEQDKNAKLEDELRK
jgi:hypothetical protein